jgi:mannitol/fructose-specific phosphotransferase system IIA component (Ntr-type)
MSETIGERNEDFLLELQSAGYTADTIVLAELTPQIQIAWADSPGQDDRIRLIFVLLLPIGAASLQQVFTTAIAASIESDYVRKRLMNISDPGEVVEVIGDGLCVAQR